MGDSADSSAPSAINGHVLMLEGCTLLENDVLGSGWIKKVHRGSEVTELRRPSKNSKLSRKKIFWVKFCL